MFWSFRIGKRLRIGGRIGGKSHARTRTRTKTKTVIKYVEKQPQEKSSDKKNNAGLIVGIILAALGSLALPGVATSDDKVMYIVLCLAMLAGGGYLIYRHYRSN